MKKLIRITIAPILFLVLFGGMFVIPIGPIALFCGLGEVLANKLSDKQHGDPEWDMIFFWFFYPWIAARQFIRNGTIPE